MSLKDLQLWTLIAARLVFSLDNLDLNSSGLSQFQDREVRAPQAFAAPEVGTV